MMSSLDSSFVLSCLSFLSFLCGLVSGAQFNLYHKKAANWEEAREYCLTMDRVLAKVDTRSKQEWIETLKPYVQGPFWIGLKGKNGTDEFRWQDASQTDYSNWATGFPGNHHELDCVRMLSTNFTWETFNCSHSLNFLCEDENHKKSYTVSGITKIKGIFFGLGAIGGLLVLVCLLLQMPCCRYSVTEKIAQIGFGTKQPDEDDLFS